MIVEIVLYAADRIAVGIRRRFLSLVLCASRTNKANYIIRLLQRVDACEGSIYRRRRCCEG